MVKLIMNARIHSHTWVTFFLFVLVWSCMQFWSFNVLISCGHAHLNHKKWPLFLFSFFGTKIRKLSFWRMKDRWSPNKLSTMCPLAWMLSLVWYVSQSSGICDYYIYTDTCANCVYSCHWASEFFIDIFREAHSQTTFFNLYTIER